MSRCGTVFKGYPITAIGRSGVPDFGHLLLLLYHTRYSRFQPAPGKIGNSVFILDSTVSTQTRVPLSDIDTST